MHVPRPGGPHAAPGETAQPYEDTTQPYEEPAQPQEEPAADLVAFFRGVWDVPLDWQPELDAALEAIDSGLLVKRRRSTDPPDSPPFPRPEGSGLTFTPEILDALAIRVAAKLRPNRRWPAEADTPPMKNGAVVSIRFRWPLFSLKRDRRRSRGR